jgi:hypothetical protein
VCEQDTGALIEELLRAEVATLTAEVERWRGFSRKNERSYRLEVQKRMELQAEIEGLRGEMP